jgi:hypothetical protein
MEVSSVTGALKEGSMQVSLFDKLAVARNDSSRDLLLKDAAAKDLYDSIGRNCETLEGVCINLLDIVLELRRRKLTLNDPDNFAQAMEYIRGGYTRKQAPKDEVLKRYTRTLNQFLLMPARQLPANPILTGSLPQWFQKGDEVACFHSGSWWHAVVVDKVLPGAKKIRVFWVGWQDNDTGTERNSKNSSADIYRNPSYCDRGDVRCYSDCTAFAKEGSLKRYDVNYILGNYVRVQVASDSEESSKAEEEKQKPDKESSSQPSAPLSSSKPSAPVIEKKPLRQSARLSSGNPAPRPESSVKKKSSSDCADDADNELSKSSSDGADDADNELSTSDSETPTLKPNPPRKNPPKPHPRPRRSSKKEPVRKQAPMSASKVEEFFWATLPTVTETCIDNLELLAAGKTVHADVEREGLAMLASRCRSLHSLYANQEFQEFLCIAQEALESYEGKQSPYQRKFMVQELKKFGFVITPRMWSKLELLMLMVIILDPKLMYMGIRQKDRKDERDQNR